jgi:hypothetical protein
MKRPSRARWIAAALCILYGFAKLNGSQFVVLDSELSRPMGDASGRLLTWYYFGYSPTYGNLIGVMQVLGGALLTFRRTALLAALVLVPVFVNIFLIDVFFHIALGATLAALLVLGCLSLHTPSGCARRSSQPRLPTRSCLELPCSPRS